MKTRGVLPWFALGSVGSARELPALILAGLWLACVLLSPLTHQLLHSRLGAHAHDGGPGLAAVEVHAHADGIPHLDDAGPQLRDKASAPHLHHPIAVNTHAPGWVVPSFVPIAMDEGPSALEEALSAPLLPELSARGPPTHT